MIEASGEAGSGLLRPRARDRRALLLVAFTSVVLTILVAGAALLTRSRWSFGETRLVAIAWEMWSSGDLLLPRLDGVPVALAPLWPWLLHAGWALLGVGEAWPRLLPALLGLANLALCAWLARLLSPMRPDAAWRGPLLLLGAPAWLAFITLAGQAMLLALCVQLGLIALVLAGHKRDGRAWLLFTVAVAIGLLAAGPLILAYVLPAAVLAPVWVRAKPRIDWLHWYGDIVKSLGLAILPAAAWLLSVTQHHDSGYALAWIASVSVSVPDFAYAGAWQPLLLLPLFLPWPLWLGWWRGLTSLTLPAWAFIGCVVVPALIFLIVAPGQPALLVPLLPMLAAFTAAALPVHAPLIRVTLVSAFLATFIIIVADRYSDAQPASGAAPVLGCIPASSQSV